MRIWDTLRQRTVLHWIDWREILEERGKKITIYLEEIDNFRPVRHGNSKDIEKYADLLDVAIVNLKESNRSEELKDGMLYIKFTEKIASSNVGCLSPLGVREPQCGMCGGPSKMGYSGG